jgi:DNA replication and repair protein RecF
MLNNIRLQNFRSYTEESIDFGPGVNIIVGPNASGKTNLLEAILILCQGTSYRASSAQLVQHKKNWAKIQSNVSGSQRVVRIKTNNSDQAEKTMEINNTVYKRLPVNKRIPAVLFEPGHLQMVIGPPEHRRNFLDNILDQTVIGYPALRNNYKRILQQRNALLKQGVGSNKSMFVWDIKLTETAAKVVKARQSLVNQMNTDISDIYRLLSKKQTKIHLKYKTGSSQINNYNSWLLKKLEESAEIDRLRGFTANGPHRDDIVFLFDQREAQQVASRGETRTLLLALKNFELKILESTNKSKPILLLDDVFSELDGQRRKALTEFLSPYQTFITTTDADVVLKHFINECKVIPTKHS